MESYKEIAEEVGASIEDIRGLMARACVKRTEIPYYRTAGDGRKVDAIEVFYTVCVEHCRPAVVLGTGDTIAEAVAAALVH